MISFDFAYFKPGTVEEAVRLFGREEGKGNKPLYYSGGTEIISAARLNQVRPGAVIDIKGIPECQGMHIREGDGQLVIGAAVPLTAVAESPFFPLLGDTARRVADHTNRNKITIGGNLCGQFFYREALLPFLLTDSQVVLAGPGGYRTVPVQLAFNGGTRLARGELLVQIISDCRYFHLPYVTVKKTKMEEIDYPLVRVVALKTETGIRAAFSGVSAVPFRSLRVEKVLNDRTLPLEQRIERVILSWPVPILDDVLGSAAYRTFVLRNTLWDVMNALEGGSA
ncbi:FAD binding domain-containing protein [Gorillibacterium massiliense]|uniref:FAD binding domain-containing protein n=1 Tax=Gorillibacterium massiliense TaxID=1280390 RepID=UPI0004AC812B|nr:FAD binding domain-containing protein [Gorillibacterium massiliense]